jgi:hypothetical protein
MLEWILRDTENSKIPFTAKSAKAAENKSFNINLCELSALRGEDFRLKRHIGYF